MAAKKKSNNYVSYELKKLDTYVSQLQDFLDKNPPNLAVDRIERIETARGTSFRVIASIEDQVKAFTNVLEKLPKLLADLDKLRKQVDEDKEEVALRGGVDRPGFMDDDDDDEEQPTAKKSNTKSKPPASKFDDDSFYEDDEKEQKQLPSSTTDTPGKESSDEEEDEDEWWEDE